MPPYVEYVARVEVPNLDKLLTALADVTRRADAEGTYGDAQHLFDHALGAGPRLGDRVRNDDAGPAPGWCAALQTP